MRSNCTRIRSLTLAVTIAGAGGAIAPPVFAEDPPTAPSAFYEIETKYIFGFTQGSGIGIEGEKEVSIESVGRFGKREGRYAATETKFEVEYTPTQYVQVEFGPLAASHYIRNVPDLENRNTFQPCGFFGEVRYLLLDRPASPVAVTLSVEPAYRAFDETGGERVQNYELETAINADVELVKNRVYAAFNAVYEPETTRVGGHWEKESNLGLTAALAVRLVPEVTLAAEVDYYRHYEGILFQTFTGDALFLGPAVYIQLARKVFMTAAWNAQVWGREVGTANRLNLEEFSRQRAKLKVAVEF
jgi:hypothetical protein